MISLLAEVFAYEADELTQSRHCPGCWQEVRSWHLADQRDGPLLFQLIEIKSSVRFKV